MRRRLRMTYVGLLAVVVLGLAVPLALALAGRAAQSMYIDRLNDAAQFASQAEPAIRTGRTETLNSQKIGKIIAMPPIVSRPTSSPWRARLMIR